MQSCTIKLVFLIISVKFVYILHLKKFNNSNNKQYYILCYTQMLISLKVPFNIIRSTLQINQSRKYTKESSKKPNTNINPGNISPEQLITLSRSFTMHELRSQEALCEYLSTNQLLRTPELRKAFTQVDRSFFAPSSNPYDDAPCYIGADATISAPHMHAIAMEFLTKSLLGSHEKDTTISFLDIGSGSGYIVGIASILLTDIHPTLQSLKRHVVGMEIAPQLVQQSKQNLENSIPKILKSPNLTCDIMHGNGITQVNLYVCMLFFFFFIYFID